MKKEEKENLERVIEFLVLAIMLKKPDMTRKKAENIIVNVGNYIQLRELKENNQTTDGVD